MITNEKEIEKYIYLVLVSNGIIATHGIKDKAMSFVRGNLKDICDMEVAQKVLEDMCVRNEQLIQNTITS